MGQARMYDLTILSIESKAAKSSFDDDAINDFAALKVRKIGIIKLLL